MRQPSVLINIKVDDSVLLKKLETGKLTNLFLFSIKKEDRHFVYYETWRRPIKTGNIFSFVIWTNYFGPNDLNIKHHRKIWSSDKIKKVLDGDIGLVFNHDTIVLKHIENKKD